MKLSIKTKEFELEYEDDYSGLERDKKVLLEDLIKLVRETQNAKTDDIIQRIPAQRGTSAFQQHNYNRPKTDFIS